MWIRSIGKTAALAALAAFAITGPSPSKAAFQLMLSDSIGTTPVTITDNVSPDLSPILGVILYSASFGAYAITVTTGQSKPVLGSSSSPHMDLNVVATKLAGSVADTLTIQLTDTGFTSSPVDLLNSIGGTLSGSISKVTAQSFVAASNTEFDKTGTAGPILTFTSSPFSGTGTTHYAGANPYSITMQTVITGGEGAGTTTFDFELNTAPEPMTVATALAGLPIAGLMLYRTRRRQAA
jgi:hypothetical protein